MLFFFHFKSELQYWLQEAAKEKKSKKKTIQLVLISMSRWGWPAVGGCEKMCPGLSFSFSSELFSYKLLQKTYLQMLIPYTLFETVPTTLVVVVWLI